MARCDHPDLCRAPAAQQLPLRRPPALRRHRPSAATGLHHTDRGRATERFAEFRQAWGERYPAIVRLWDSAWAELVPFLAFDVEIRTIICTTNAIESVNARIRRAVKTRGTSRTRPPPSNASTWRS